MKTYKSLSVFKKYPEEENLEELEEGVFGDIFATVKLSKALAKLAQKMQKSMDPKNPESVRAEFKKMLNDGMKLIDQSKMSLKMKESFIDGYLGGLFGRLKELAPEYSGSDLKRAFEIPDHIYQRMLSAAIRK